MEMEQNLTQYWRVTDIVSASITLRNGVVEVHHRCQGGAERTFAHSMIFTRSFVRMPEAAELVNICIACCLSWPDAAREGSKHSDISAQTPQYHCSSTMISVLKHSDISAQAPRYQCSNTTISVLKHHNISAQRLKYQWSNTTTPVLKTPWYQCSKHHDISAQTQRYQCLNTVGITLVLNIINPDAGGNCIIVCYIAMTAECSRTIRSPVYHYHWLQNN